MPEVARQTDSGQDDLNFRDGKHQELDSLTVADKWVVISQHMLEAFKRVSDPWNKNDMDEIEKLKGVATMADLECLEVLLRTRPISWLGLFIDKNGLNHLVNGLEQSRKEDKRYAELRDLFRKSLLSSSFPLTRMLQNVRRNVHQMF